MKEIKFKFTLSIGFVEAVHENLKVIWGRQNPELLTEEELSHWMNCHCK